MTSVSDVFLVPLDRVKRWHSLVSRETAQYFGVLLCAPVIGIFPLIHSSGAGERTQVKDKTEVDCAQDIK